MTLRLPVDAAPSVLVDTHHETTVTIAHPRQAVWDWLCDPATFVDGQVWPWRVEFIDPDTGEDAGFEPGVLTNHHGPLMNFSGVIGEVREPEYRDLGYTYGAFMIGPRFCRPTRLQFWLDELDPTTTQVRIAVDAQVRRGLVWASSLVQRAFWARFGRWGTAAVSARRG